MMSNERSGAAERPVAYLHHRGVVSVPPPGMPGGDESEALLVCPACAEAPNSEWSTEFPQSAADLDRDLAGCAPEAGGCSGGCGRGWVVGRGWTYAGRASSLVCKSCGVEAAEHAGPCWHGNASPGFVLWQIYRARQYTAGAKMPSIAPPEAIRQLAHALDLVLDALEEVAAPVELVMEGADVSEDVKRRLLEALEGKRSATCGEADRC